MRRLVLLCALVALLSGCGGATPPEVTFSAGAASVVAKPTQYCDLKLQNCQSDANAPVRLAVPAGTALKVTVPDEISSTPWQVVFTYRSANGSQTDGRSPVLTPDQHPDYTLQLPAATWTADPPGAQPDALSTQLARIGNSISPVSALACGGGPYCCTSAVTSASVAAGSCRV